MQKNFGAFFSNPLYAKPQLQVAVILKHIYKRNLLNFLERVSIGFVHSEPTLKVHKKQCEAETTESRFFKEKVPLGKKVTGVLMFGCES